MKLNISTDLKLPIEAVTQTFAILAKRGVGKTYTGCVMVEEMLTHNQQVVVIDPVGVWWGLRSSADGKSPGFPIVVFGGEHGDVPLEENAGEIVAQSIIENGFSAVIDLSLFRKAAQNRFMLAFAETLYRLNRKPLHLVVDEADEFAPQRPLKGAERLLGAFEDIVRRGRARGLGVTLITQRAAVLNKNVLTQIEVLVVLRTISPQDREAIEAWTEIHGTKEQLQQLSETMASLPIGTAWFWSPGWLDEFKKIAVRKKTTFDSSATPEVGKTIQKPKALAEVNLEQLGAKIKATAESAKANDPAALKKRVAELERQLKSQKPVVDVREVSVLKEADRDLINKAIKACEEIRRAWDVHGDNICKIQGDLQRLVLNGKPLPIVQDVQKIYREHSKPVVAVPRRSVGNRDSLDLGKCERAILTALAQYPNGRDANQVAVLTGYSVNSGNFNNSLSKLRSQDFINRGQSMLITEAGLNALGDFDPLPTGEELQRHWLQRLAKCEAAILQSLLSVYPEGRMTSEIAQMTNYQASSGGFNNSLSRLRTLELITRTQPIKASDNFFQ